MKKYIPTCIAVLCLLMMNAAIAGNPASEKPEVASSTCFVEYNDGSIKEFKSLELVTGFFKAPQLLADGQTALKAQEIKAYRDSKGRYAVSTKNMSGTKAGKVATETLPGFALRMAKGKINLYAIKHYNGRITTTKFYLQQGNSAAIVPFNQELFNSLIKNDAEVTGFCEGKLNAKDAAKCLLAAVEMYNRNAEALTKN